VTRAELNDDPRLRRIAAALGASPPPPAPSRPFEASVALLLRPGSDLDLLLIRRAQHAGDPWSGHVALPGGRRHPDEPLVETARRETLEEIGFDLRRHGKLLGGLPPVAPASRRLPELAVSPFVFAVEPGHDLVLDAKEVDAAVWVPLAELRDERAAGEILIEVGEGNQRFPSLTWQDYVVWGLTLRILHQFFELIDRG
jgi:8-oxo-dGTP pyrophosphatase MutT (NUDIX family)